MRGCVRRRQLLLALALLVLAYLLSSNDVVTAQSPFCFNNGNYTTNSTYEANLNDVVSSLSRNVNDTGFSYASSGQNQDRAYASALCRGDLQLQACRACIQNATADLRNSCPNQKQAIMWYELCTVRYSNESILGIMVNSPIVTLANPQNVSRPDEFQPDLRSLLDSLRAQAADGGSLRKVAARNVSGPDFDMIFAMVQCTPDLSPEDCNRCLFSSIGRLPECCRLGVRVLRPSCNVRYETNDPFYNETRLLELAPVPPVSAPPPSPPRETGPLTPPPGSGNSNTTRTIIIIVVAVVVCLMLAVLIGVILRKRMKQKQREEPHHEVEDEISTVESLQYDFDKIRAATDDFSDANKLGQGGFGSVYKGMLPSGQEIAVKRLSRTSGQGDLEFKNEVLLLARLQHRNLVRLMGFSLEGVEKLLVYEFVQNASLDQFIFDSTGRSCLDWDRRYKIIGGIARGLLYLHEDSRLRIIHRDLKASNVLLDGDMNPKIADFGMARLFDRDETQGSTSRIVGTYGYMAPEYAMRGQFSVKSDVFSFGVLILEIISGQKNNSFRNGENVEDLLTCAWRNWHEGTAVNLIDPVLRAASGVPRDILRCIHIALLCVQENAYERPTMASVVLMLNSFSITLPMPSEIGSFVPRNNDSETALLHEVNNSRETESGKSSNSTKSAHYSQNEASLTELYPR